MKYSVITINFNNAEGLRHTIDSVMAQTCSDFEFIIIDGGSTDGSVETIKRYEDRIDFWISENDNGIYHAMNKGVKHAHGDYCIFMNSGDCFYNSTVLETINNCRSSSDIIVGKVAIDDKDSIISPPPLDGELTFYHLFAGAIPHQGAFIRAYLLRKYPYDENLKIISDWKFFVQSMIFGNCSVSFLEVYIARYDMDGVSSLYPELMRREKEKVMSSMLPLRVLEDYRKMKDSQCLTFSLAPALKKHYRIDRLLYKLGSGLLKFVSR
jgi:glycosyltransferase involved in cell wall biosynthesis